MVNKTPLNKEQKEAVFFEDGPLLIIAGAGSGKTTVITERIKHLIFKKNIKSDEILALTFTEKSALEMEERIDVALPYGYGQMWISTFHAFCDRVLRNDAFHIGLDPSYSLATESQIILFLKKKLFKFNLNYFRPLGNPNKFILGLLQHFNRLKDEDVNPQDYLKYAKLLKEKNEIDSMELEKINELVNAYQTYENLKVEKSVMDFSDLISNTLKLFRLRKNVLKEYQQKFKYILIDEFQDTNYAQNTLAILLAGEKQNITVVGDDDQAIYRWRGAAISNMIQFKQNFPKAKIITLIKNYRSTETILDASYKLIQNNNPDRLEVKENINKKLISMRKKKGSSIELIYSERVEHETENVVKKIKELMKNKKYSFKDFAILVRANDYSQPFTKAFSQNNIPYQFLGPSHLFEQEEIKDFIAYLKVLCNFNDSSCLYRILNMNIFDINSRDIAAILNYAKRKNVSLFEAIEITISEPLKDAEINKIIVKKETVEKLKNIYHMINEHIKMISKTTAGQIMYFFLKDSGLLNEIVNNAYPNNEKISQNIAKFFEKLKSFETEQENANVFTVIEWIDLLMQTGESPSSADIDWSENDAVNILTIHSSKGLEFPNVFLVNLVSQRFPTRERREQIPIPQDLIKEILPSGDFHIEEERRLFYVGMTRAKDNLFFTASNFYGEGKSQRRLSPFIFEIFGKDEVNKFIENKKNKKSIIQESLLEWSENKKQEEKTSIRITPFSKKLTYISYSQLQTFDICPLHYKLKYVLKIPTSPSASQSFGTSIHNVLRDYYSNWIKGEKITSNTIDFILKKNWVDEGYENKDHEQKSLEKAKKVITSYLEKNFNKDFDPKNVVLEAPFQFFISDSSTYEKIKIGGRIDRIDKYKDGKIEIIDYKTGSNIPNDKKLKEDLQLTFYALAATHLNNLGINKQPEEILLSLHYLEEDKKFTTTRTKEQLKEAKEKIFSKISEIENSEFLCSKSMFCFACEYKILCAT